MANTKTKTSTITAFPTAICPICGKEFCYSNRWIYRLRVKKQIVKYCSWTCMRKAEKSSNAEPVKPSRYLIDDYSSEWLIKHGKRRGGDT